VTLVPTTARIPAGARTSREVLVTWPDYDVEAEQLGAALVRAGLDMRLEPKRGARTTADMVALVASASGAIVSTDPFDADVLDRARHLRVIARVGVGTDSIDLDAATANGVVVTVTPGANEVTVADHTIALMLAVLRRVGEHDAGIRAGRWERTGAHTPWLLGGATVGLLGYGQIGRLVARRLSGFDVRILVHDLGTITDPQVEQVDLDQLLSAADVVSLHTPLTPATRGLIGARELGLLKPTAVLVNTARGGIVDEVALEQALLGHRIRGAGLDVFAAEPPPASRLLTLPNVVLSPHNAGLSEQSIDEMLQRATASVVDVLAGRLPANVANPAVLQRKLADA
jgi:phosphoglycerate dehydrogenase-like enzyme